MHRPSYTDISQHKNTHRYSGTYKPKRDSQKARRYYYSNTDTKRETVTCRNADRQIPNTDPDIGKRRELVRGEGQFCTVLTEGSFNNPSDTL